MNQCEASSVRLYHPKGPAATLALPAEPKAALLHVTACLEAGWLPNPPGLEAGEQQEQVGHVLRGECANGDGSLTPYLLLYGYEEPNSYSFLKVYLNKPQDIAAFEFASGMKLQSIAEYVGDNKPEKGKNQKTDKYIVPAPRPFGVVFKSNPKYSEAESAAAKQRNDVYKVPRRLFVRWVDQMPAQPNSAAPQQPAAQPKSTGAAPAPAKGTKPQPQPVSLAERHTHCLAGIRNATTLANYKEWSLYARKFEFDHSQWEQLDDASRDTLERLGHPVGAEPHF